jgi:hypothetical protein
VARREHHEAKIRANTKVYENKAVIGGTIVGCIQRLEAIRYIFDGQHPLLTRTNNQEAYQ